jgi:hypothetical protein
MIPKISFETVSNILKIQSRSIKYFLKERFWEFTPWYKISTDNL